MTLIALIAQPIAFAVIVWLVLRHAAGRDVALDRLAADANVTSRRLVDTIERERDARRDEIQMLLQRIQAPEHAVVQHAVAHAGPEPDGRPRTEQESAEASDDAVKARAILDEIERMEHDEHLRLGLVAE